MKTKTTVKAPVFAEIELEDHQPDPEFVAKSDALVAWWWAFCALIAVGFVGYGLHIFGFLQSPNEQLQAQNAELTKSLGETQAELSRIKECLK